MRKLEPGPGQESVWDYPRPPRVERTAHHILIEFAGQRIAETERAWRVLETSHPPTYYIPIKDVKAEYLEPSTHRSYCEFKGDASYWTLVVGERKCKNAAWSLLRPKPGYSELRDCLAFYPSRVDACFVNGERVTPQEGDFYGGWITSWIVGPIKGGPGTLGW